MNQSIKKVLLVCSLFFLSISLPVNVIAENTNELTFDTTQGKFQDFLNAQSGDVKITLNSTVTDSIIDIPDTISSLDINLNDFRIYYTIYANGVPLSIHDGQIGTLYGGSYNTDINADTSITLDNVRINGKLYGGGHSDSEDTSANIYGITHLYLNDVVTLEEVKQGVGNSYEIYGGGYAEKGGTANVTNSIVTINGGLLYSVYGGGYADTGAASVEQKSTLTIKNATSYGDLTGCGNPVGQDSSTTCGTVDLSVEETYFPTSERMFGGLQSGYIIGGSESYSRKDNIVGTVFNEVSINVKNTSIYAEIIGGGLTFGEGDFSVGSINLTIDGVKEFYEPRLDQTISNSMICLGGAISDSDVHGDINVVINNCDLGQIVVTEGDSVVEGSTTIEFQTGGKITGLEGIDAIILGKPIEITNYIHDPTPIQVELKGKWENDVKAITLGGVADDSLFTGSNLVYGEDTASYWMTAGITDIPVPEPEPDPEPDHSSSSNSGSSSSSTIIKGDTETSVKVDNKNSSLSEKVVKKLVEDNQNVPVVIESKEVKITYPKGAMTEMNEGISLKVEINGKDATTKKAAEVAGETGSMTLNFKEESMFSKNQPIKIEVKAKPELKGKQLYYKKYDEATNQLLFVQPTAVNEDGWLEVSQTEAGCYVVTDSIDPYWQQSITGDWYYFNEQGAIVTGWMADNNNWYYLEDKGTMHVGWLNLDNTWYCTNDNGKLVTGWNPQGDVWYYHDGSGSLVKNEWVWDAGWYYINDEGKMLRDGYTPDGYHVNSSGIYDY